RELSNILKSQQQLLSHYMWDSFYSGDVTWVYKGKELKNVASRGELNKHLTTICNDVYSETPVFKNELINKHSVSSPIQKARKDYFSALVNHYDKEDLGYPKENFPPDKTIY